MAIMKAVKQSDVLHMVVLVVRAVANCIAHAYWMHKEWLGVNPRCTRSSILNIHTFIIEKVHLDDLNVYLGTLDT